VVTAQVGADYTRAVQGALARRGEDTEFVPQERSWGEKQGDVFVEGKDGELYLVVHEKSRSAEEFFVDGVAVPTTEVVPYLVPKKPGPGGITYRNPKLRNVVSVSYGGTTYRVVHPVAEVLGTGTTPPVIEAVRADTTPPVAEVLGTEGES
jgi:hypothetical protein